MARLLKNTTETYEAGQWLVDIEEKHTKWGLEYGAWLYRKQSGIKQFMVGMMAKNISKENFTDYIFDCLRFDRDGYKADYDEMIADVEAGNMRRFQEREGA
jgi:hypothetical protein